MPSGLDVALARLPGLRGVNELRACQGCVKVVSRLGQVVVVSPKHKPCQVVAQASQGRTDGVGRPTHPGGWGVADVLEVGL